MREKATGEAESQEGEEVSLYEVINTLIAHGHKKEEILRNYSREEITLFYEKCIKLDLREKADFIESVVAGIGGAFGGGKQLEKLLTEMRK